MTKTATRTKTRPTNDQIVAELTTTIVTKITGGTAGTWTKPWDSLTAAGLPFNAVTHRRYNGINLLILGLDERAATTGDPRWMTYRQAAGNHWQVRKGETATKVLLAKEITLNNEEDDNDDNGGAKRRRVLLRTFNVFHASQIDGIPPWTPRPPSGPQRHATIDGLIDRTGARIRHGGDRAYYRPVTDTITVPPPEAFTCTDGYYATVLHELAHWTGGATPPRVSRDCDTTGTFGSTAYAREEVRVELATAIIMAELGLRTPSQATDCHAYIASWITALNDDPREVITATRDAQTIAAHLLTYLPTDAPAPGHGG